MTAPDSPIGSDDRGPAEPRLSTAADGGTARLRFPGGRLQPTDWTALAQIAAAHSGDLRLTSRGHVEVQGVREEAQLREQVETAGLIPGAAHDRARTILASPMAGRLPGHHDLADLPEKLDAALLSRADVASLSAGFLFGFDDGSGDVLAHCADLTAVAGPRDRLGDRVGGRVGDEPGDGPGGGLGDGFVRLHVGGRDIGLATAMADAATVLADAAATFAASADGQWRVPVAGELHDLVVVALSDHPLTSHSGTSPDASSSRSIEVSATVVPPVGWVDTSDGLVSLLAVVPHGLVPARLAEFLGAIERPSTISADRVIGLHRLTEGMAEQVVRVLAPMGMVFDAKSPWVTGSA